MNVVGKDYGMRYLLRQKDVFCSLINDTIYQGKKL